MSFPPTPVTRLRRLAALVAWLAWVALAPPSSAQHYRTVRYTELDGMQARHALDLVQAHDGAMWVATGAGLSRFDGRTWTEVDLPFAPSRLCVDASGRLWAAGPGPSLAVSAGDGRFDEVDGPAELVGSDVVDLQPLGGASSVALVTSHDGVWIHADDAGGWTCPVEGPSGRLWSASGGPGGLWVAGEGGLSRLNGGGWVHDLAAAAGLPEGPTFGVSGTAAGDVWVAGSGWIGRLRGGHGEVLLEDGALSFASQGERNGTGPRLLDDGAGGAWVGSAGLLFHIDGVDGEVTRGAGVVGLLGESIDTMLRDRDGNTWFGSARGLSRLPSLRFAVWDRTDGLLDDEVTALALHPDGRLIIGHNSGLSVLDGQRPERLVAPRGGVVHAVDERVLDLAVAPDGTLWMARTWAGLWSVSPEGLRRHHALPAPTDGAERQVSGVALAPDGTLWVTASDGVFTSTDGGARFVLVDPDSAGDGLPKHAMARRAFVDGDEVWVAFASEGVSHRNARGVWSRHRMPSAEGTTHPANSVYAVRRHGGRVLLGTRDGLYELRDGRFVRPGAEGLRIDAPVYFLLDDPQHHELWIGTLQGVVRWDGREAHHYAMAQGLPASETNRAAAVLDAEGRVWFGTNGGLVLHQREHDGPAPLPPVVGAPRVEVGGELRPWGDGLSVDHDEDLTFDVPAISFLDDGRVELQVRLEGYDDDWLPSSAAAGGRVRYTGLPAGSYRLHVRARAGRGPWSDERISPLLSISEPWWSQPWFGVLSGLGVLGLLALLLRAQAQRAQAERLERLVEQRTRDLAQAEQRYREMFDKNGTAQLLLDTDGWVLAANEAAVQVWQPDGAGPTGRSLDELLRGDAPDLVAQLGSLPPGRRWHEEVVLSEDRGPARHLALEACVYDLLDQRRVHLTAIDVTELRRIEEQLQHSQQMESLGRLAGGVAHDFNNLLTAVIGHAEHALGSDPQEAHAHLRDIVAAARRGSGMTRRLLGLARHTETRPQVVDASGLVRDLAPMLQSLLRDDVTLSAQTAPIEGRVRIDPGEVEQVLCNLIVNAADAMPRGGSIVLALEDDAQLGEVRLSISDTGEGMEPEVLQHALQPFFTTKPPGVGTGLGLSNCAAIVGRAGGRLGLTSRPGVGTTVTIHLPRLVEPADVTEPETSEPSRTAAPGETVLVVEDQDLVRDVAAMSLERLGYRVLLAGDGASALALARAWDGPIHLLLSDVVMPGMGGRELAERLLAERPDLRVLFTSGYTADGLPAAHLRPGGGELLQKPYRLADLAAAVRRALDGNDDEGSGAAEASDTVGSAG